MEDEVFRQLTLSVVLDNVSQGTEDPAVIRDRIIYEFTDRGFYPGNVLSERGLERR